MWRRVADVIQDRSDEELLARVAAGDNAALGMLYDRYATTVYSLALRTLGDPQAAEELVQEAMLRVWRQARSYQRERGAPTTWIFGIARNLAIDELRKRGARPQSAGGDPEEQLAQLPSGDADPAEQAYAQIQHEIVTDALGQLPPVQREVLELAYYSGLSQSEIARRLGDPLGTVKTRMRLGLQRLRTLLNPSETGVGTP